MFFCGGFFSSSVCLLVSKCLKKRLSESQTPRPRKPFLHGKCCLQAWLRFWVHWYMFSSDSGGCRSLGALSCELREPLLIRWYTRTTSAPDCDAPRRSRGQPTVALPRIDGIGHTCSGRRSGPLREFDLVQRQGRMSCTVDPVCDQLVLRFLCCGLPTVACISSLSRRRGRRPTRPVCAVTCNSQSLSRAVAASRKTTNAACLRRFTV